ncbi:MAG: hypothetical protein CVV44_12850 [Spirochaetae bacterium HGW-Spirochaetae-1]|jgi:RNA polymerase sigma-70 factor (ECF subfamily)|nr:MAG: hypothetical protein CVV44_12850 [Spirochaetae bacterium HGW-Spirochaetae-1]
MNEFSQTSDEDLVKIFRAGDEKAFNALYARYYQKLFKLIYYYVRDTDLVEDVLHNVFIRVFRHVHTFNPQKSFSAWIYQIAVNCSKNELKKRKRHDDLVRQAALVISEKDEAEPSPEDVILTRHDIQAFSDAVNSLKERFRDVFLLRFDHKMKYSDIATVLKCSERTAKWRMKRAVENIALFLSDRGII